MLTAIEGTYKDGHVQLNEQPIDIRDARVVVTFLPTTTTNTENIKMRFGQFSADGVFNHDDFASAEWRGRTGNILMAKQFVADTHALVWFLAGDKRLSSKALKIFEATDTILLIPAIVIAEACWIASRGRTGLLSAEAVLGAIRKDGRCRCVPLDERIVGLSLGLTSINEMHDRLIVATTLVLTKHGETLPLITRDENITESCLLDTLW